MIVELNLELEQMDVETMFPYGDHLHETTKGFEVGDKKDYVCKLNRSFYGLKESPRQWNKCFEEFIARIAFERSKYDTCIYFKFLARGHFIVLLLYVDDIFSKRSFHSIAIV